jgi:hypothetical protein
MEGVIKGTHPDYPGELIHMHCLGFDFMDGGIFLLEQWLDKEEEIFITLRDAKCILPSYFAFGSNYEAFNNKVVFGGYLPNFTRFLNGEYAVPRICKFLNGVYELSKHRKINILYYEDRFRVESVYEVPRILGIDYQLTLEEAEQIFQDTEMSTIKAGRNMEVASSDIGSMYRIGSPKSSLSILQQEKIDKYLRDNCLLQEYRERYL